MQDNGNKEKKYEWIGDVKSYKEPEDNEHSVKYNEPDRDYDATYRPTKADIETFPDLQNGPSSLIQGAPVEIQQVGIHNFRLPLKYEKRGGGDIELETRVTGTVSLAAHKKGINMSRIMRSFYKFKDDYVYDKLDDILMKYKDNLDSFDAKIGLHFSYPILQPSLRSNNAGYQYYNVTLEGNIDHTGNFKKILHFDFVYSSACPCSYELAEHARKYRNKATVSHSQRSVARISIEFDKIVWIEDLQEMCAKALKTETQVVVKREDEMAFAELNGSYLKFVEDAARLLYEQLSEDKRVKDFRVICSHQESLHSHDAVSVILAPNSKFSGDIPHEVWSSLIHIS
jgi:GTP cyclohydrolase I